MSFKSEIWLKLYCEYGNCDIFNAEFYYHLLMIGVKFKDDIAEEGVELKEVLKDMGKPHGNPWDYPPMPREFKRETLKGSEGDEGGFQRMKDSKYPIYVNAFEAGILTAVISTSDKKEELKEVFRQLLNLHKKFREEAGVKETDLGDNLIRLEDKYGNVIIRKKYEWER